MVEQWEPIAARYEQTDRMFVCIDEPLCEKGTHHTDVVQGRLPVDGVEGIHCIH